MKNLKRIVVSVVFGVSLACTVHNNNVDRDAESGDADHAPNLHFLVPAVDVRHYENEIQSGYPNIDVIVSPNDGVAQGETAVAINPLKPNIIITAANDYRGENGGTRSYLYYSTNTGQTWTNILVPSVTNSFNYNGLSDPSLAYDADGDAYYCYGAFNTTNTGADGPSGVVVARSLDGGITWNAPVIAKASDANSFEDKYYIGVDASTTSPYKNNVYVSWTHFITSGSVNQSSDIYCVRSTNKGVSWLTPVKISNSAYGHLSMPTVGPNGDVYIVWSETSNGQTGIMSAHSSDGGATFSTPKMVGGGLVTTLPSKLAEQGNIRMLTYPVAAVDRSSLHSGRVFVTWAAMDNGSGVPHIFMSTSDNKGASWSSPVIIDGDPTSMTNKFHPWMTCDPTNGTVAISYYDARNDASNIKVDLYVSVSGDGGANFSAKRITNTNFSVNPYNGGYWADYTAITAYKGKIVPCWTDQRAGNSVNNTDVYMSIFSLGPNTVVNLAASISETAQSSITLNWIDPTTYLSGAALTNFTVVIYRDSQYLASVNKGVQTYADNFLTTGSFHSYQVYVASGSDTSDLAATSAYAGGALTPQPAVLLSVRETDIGTELRWKNPTKHVDGTAMYDLGSVKYFVDSVQFGGLGLNTSDTGQIMTQVVQAPIKKFHSFSVAVATQRNGIATYAAPSATMIWYSGAPTTALTEGFESSPVMGSNGGWTTTALGAHSGTHSLVDNSLGKTQAGKNIFAMLTPVVVQAGATEFSFWHVPSVSTVDSAVAEFTTDHGQTWRAIGRYVFQAGKSDSIKNATWTNVTYDMKPYIGDSIVVRFRMHSSASSIASLHKQGWFVDDVTLRAPSGVAEAPMLPQIPMLVTAAPNPFSVSTFISAEGVVVPRDGSQVFLHVYDIAGRQIADLTSQLQSSGLVHAQFNAAAFPAGMYFARLHVGNREGTVQFVLQR